MNNNYTISPKIREYNKGRADEGPFNLFKTIQESFRYILYDILSPFMYGSIYNET